VRIKLQGEVDISNCEELLTEFLVEVGNDGVSPTIEIECAELEFIDSSGLSMLTRLTQLTGKRVVLLSVPARCRRTFEITNLDEVFELRDT
jgi:anti-anti-sigma factor